MYRLKCAVQWYAWGKLGSTSEVANLVSSADSEFKIDNSQPYAELWMGTHSKGPSRLEHDGQLLSDWLTANPSAIGEKLIAVSTNNQDKKVQLPFLFKILSVHKALSIQVHPTKEQARKLHMNDPLNYPDDNHKPEMAIALSPFELLCGFRPPTQILRYIKEIPELFELVGGPAYQQLAEAIDSGAKADDTTMKLALKTCFTQLMSRPEPIIQKNVASLTHRVALKMKTMDKTDEWYTFCELVIRLNYFFPGDVGCLAAFFLNHFALQPGEASFLGPNEPHAYLFGDCIECMACSDNTIRAGLTPKYKDIGVLCQSLTYRMAGTEHNKFTPYIHIDDTHVTVYDPPVPEFVVHKIEIASAIESYDMLTLPTCSLLIVIHGKAKLFRADQLLSRGHVILIPANHKLQLQIDSAPWIAFRAFCDENTVESL